MNFTDSLLHRSLVVLGYVVQGAAFVNEIGLKAGDLGIQMSPWVRAGIFGAGLLATKLAAMLPTNELKATPGVEDNTGAALGKASGEAALRAANQAFKKL